jgi:hypothetical protein
VFAEPLPSKFRGDDTDTKQRDHVRMLLLVLQNNEIRPKVMDHHGVHSALVTINEELLERKVATPV